MKIGFLTKSEFDEIDLKVKMIIIVQLYNWKFPMFPSNLVIYGNTPTNYHVLVGIGVTNSFQVTL